MSIDNYIWVPAGIRNNNTIGYRKYKSWSGLLAAESPTATLHQVFLAHQHLIDEQYFFEDPEDARWFWAEGYKGRLLLDNDVKTAMPYDRMALWIGGEELATHEHPSDDAEEPEAPVLRADGEKV